MAVAYATKEFERKGQVPAMWIIAAGPNIMWVETRWENDREKELSVRAIRGAMKELGARAYSFVTEAWVASYPIDDPGTVPPSQRPKNERDDVLMVTTFDSEGEYDATRFLVTIGPRGPNLLGPRDDLSTGRLEGRMYNLLVT